MAPGLRVWLARLLLHVLDTVTSSPPTESSWRQACRCCEILHDTFKFDVLTSAFRLVRTRARLSPSASSTAFSTSATAWATPMPVFKWTTLISKVRRVFLSFQYQI